MKRFLRICGAVAIFVAVFAIALRGVLGISFLMEKKDFYPPAGRFLVPQKETVKFAIFSDTGSKNWTLERLISNAKDNERPDFMLHLGDLVVYRNIEHMHWMMNGLQKKLGDVPLYLVAGNHDVKSKKRIDKSKYQCVFGPLYYWFGYGDTLFIGLDSSTEEIDDEQWAFFEQVMKRVRPSFKHAILFTHVPPIVPPDYLNHTLKKESVERMTKILKKYPVDAIFSGHVHYYSEQNFNGIPVYTTPPSGQYFVGPVRRFGYLVVEVDKKGVHVKNVYSDCKKKAELFELFFVDLILTDKVRWIAGAVFLVGIVLWLIGQKGIPCLRKKRK